MENSSATTSKNSSVQNLSLSLEKLSLRKTPNGSLTKTQQVDIAAETSIENPMPAPIPLYSNKIWAAHANSGFAVPSTSNNPFGVNTASGSQGVRDYMLNSNFYLNLFGGGIVSQNSSLVPQYKAIAGSGYGFHNSRWNSGGFSNQQNLDIAGFLDENFFGSLKSNEFIKLARNQTGSDYLQRKLISKDPAVRQKILEGVFDYIFELMTDEYGHYVFGTLIDSCSNNQLQQIVEKITLQCEQSKFNDATKNEYGADSIKNLIRVLKKSPLIFKVLFALYKGFYEIMTDRVGSYVMLKCLDVLDAQKNEILYRAVIEHWQRMVTHEHGCTYLNEFISKMKGPYRDQILDLLSTHSVFLAQDPLGNYVLQHIIDLHHPTLTKKICYELKGHYIKLSLMKVASHVVEKCMKSSGVDLVIEDFLKSGSSQLLQVARDQYGNFVIQSALKITKETNTLFHQNLLMKLQPYHHCLQTGPGRHVLNLIRSWVNNA